MMKSSVKNNRLAASLMRGFTLVELMVAMVIGIFLSMALSGIYISLKRSFLSEDSIISMQENQRLALSVLTTGIQSSGYFVDTLVNDINSVFVADGKFTSSGQVIYGSVSNSKPSLSVRYQTKNQDGIMNCAGIENTTGADAIFTNTFSINDSNELICTASINSGDPVVAVLSRNISKMEVLYASDSDANGSVDGYFDAAKAEAFGWKNVHGVRIDLTFMDTINASESDKKAMPKPVTQYINLMNTYEVAN